MKNIEEISISKTHNMIRSLYDKYRSKFKKTSDIIKAISLELDISENNIMQVLQYNERKLKRYKPLFEKRIREYKAWYNPNTDKFIQFHPNLIHDEIAEENFRMDNEEALKHGYYRIWIGKQFGIETCNIESQKIPTDREFIATRYVIDENSYKKFNHTHWEVVSPRKSFVFPENSFFFRDSIK